MRYEKPIVNVIDLQIKENIAAVDTTVYKGAAGSYTTDTVTQMALNQTNSGIASASSEGLVNPS